MQDVATHAGVGVGTVSRALNDSGYVDGETRQKILSSARTLGYQPNAVARALRAQRTAVAGLVVPDLRNQFYAESSAVLHSLLTKAGYQLLVTVSNDDPDVERHCLEVLSSQQVDGIVRIPVNDAPLAEFGTRPIVELNRRSEGGFHDAVVANESEGVRKLTELLVDAGHQDIALVVGSSHHSTARDRTAGYHWALDEAGVTHRRVLAGDYSAEWGTRAFHDVINGPTTGAVIAGSQIMEGFIEASRSQRARIPEDLSIAGVGDPSWYRFWQPAITTYAPDLAKMGRIAAERMLLRLSQTTDPPEPETLLVPGAIRARESIRPPRTV